MNTFYTGMDMKTYGKTIFNCTYMNIPRTITFDWHILVWGCTWYKRVCTLFIHVHSVSYLEKAKPFPAQCDVQLTTCHGDS